MMYIETKNIDEILGLLLKVGVTYVVRYFLWLFFIYSFTKMMLFCLYHRFTSMFK